MASPWLLSSLPSLRKNSMPWITFSHLLSSVHLPWIAFLLIALFTSSFVSAAKIPYADHCDLVVPESTATTLFVDSRLSFQISKAYFSGGGKLFHSANSLNVDSPPFFYFNYKYLHKTRSPDILQIEGTLVLLGAMNRTQQHRNRFPRNSTVEERVTLDLFGFWSESTGKLCMVGHGLFEQPQGNSLHLSAILNLNYPKTSNVSTSLINGTVESLDPTDNPNHFEPIFLLAYAKKKYEFTMIPQANSSCSSPHFKEESISVEPASTCDHLLEYRSGRVFRIDYKSNDCTGSNCRSLGSSLGFTPRFLSLEMAQCSENGSIHLYIGFSNSSSYSYSSPMIPEKSLVGEGYWDPRRNQLCLIACRMFKGNSQNSFFVDDCNIGLSLWFPAVMTLRNRSDIVGRIWSNKNQNDDSYFSMVTIRSMRNGFMIPGLKYNYSGIDSVGKLCSMRSGIMLGEKRYPDGKSTGGMSYFITCSDDGGRRGWGHATMLSVGDMFYGDRGHMMLSSAPAVKNSAVNNSVEVNQSIWNVSFVIRYAFWSASDEEAEIAAEGLYNAGTGTLCMKGCRYPNSPLANNQGAALDSESIDCEILIKIQLPPLNPKIGEQMSGTISSTRKKSDALYFDPINFKSHYIYGSQAIESIWRMDVEITMVLISLTLSCICIAWQTFHVKKHKDILPSISIMMLVILVLGYLIPLVLNFEASFMNPKQHNVLLQSGGWLEVNEVIVRVMSMVAFFLSFRLIQLAWSARSDEESKGYWIREGTVFKLCLPLYFAGGLLTWLVYSRWEGLISYSGLVLDGFLLPQIILNTCRNSKAKVLTPLFYVGITITRALPHLYDAYRARHYVPTITYIYGSSDRDFYSSAWDVIIPCEGLLLASLIYLQQRFGGGFFLPRRLTKFVGYEAVPVVSLALSSVQG